MPLDKPNKVSNDSITTPYTIINSDVAELGTTVATFYSGTTAQRPSVNVAIGDQFYNTQLKQLEIYTTNGWVADSTGTQAPTNVTAANDAVAYGGSPAVIVNFVPATSGNPAATYTVTSTPGSITVTGTSSPITVPGLTGGTSYTFTVTATNTYGSATSAASPSIVAGTISNVPTIGTATNQGGVISVPFTAPSPNTGASTITGYTVVSSPGNKVTQGTSSPISVFGLTPGTPYTFVVSANNNAGSSAFSSASNSVIPQNTATVTGGTVASALDATYQYQTFTSSGNLVIGNLSVTADILVIAGGGAGGVQNAGGGGAGGVQLFSNQSLAAGTYAVTVGNGGVGGRTTAGYGQNGSFSQFGSFGASVGGGGGAGTESPGGFTGSTGGSGGGGGNTGANGSGGAGTSGQGNNGGAGGDPYAGGGGGGAGGTGSNAGSTTGGNGGSGTNAYATWLSAITSAMSGVSGWAAATSGGYIAGGGGGGGNGNASGGSGGGGYGSADGGAFGAVGSGVANTGSGGGAARNPQQGNGAGGKGIVIVRYTRSQVGV
jgi:hypothetical protein